MSESKGKRMHCLFFEVRPKLGHLVHYFEHVERLRPALSQHEGLEYIERFTSLTEPDLLLSHQLWRDEDAIIAWRKDVQHRQSQTAGRKVHFADYRIRVGRRILHWRAAAENGPAFFRGDPGRNASYVVALYGSSLGRRAAYTSFESVTRKGRLISLFSTTDLETAEAALTAAISRRGLDEAAVFSIHRDYGMMERAQAPRPTF
ncbi:antibiotic biosynthesis monooxygenase family protein [Palleronia pelagia]|uniref:antibiotic biosynthesis monooxygenase family protein n=1 Tax=Palleronia pelagia TaxID=387096 RepID=UPI000B8360BF|nr:antibiotic biosynthesis monooxygenase family protein [Palleronia pelagia]